MHPSSEGYVNRVMISKRILDGSAFYDYIRYKIHDYQSGGGGTITFPSPGAQELLIRP